MSYVVIDIKVVTCCGKGNILEVNLNVVLCVCVIILPNLVQYRNTTLPVIFFF